MTKLKIDLVNGILDIEGEESFVREIYNEYKDKLHKFSSEIPKETLVTPPAVNPIEGSSTGNKKPKGGAKGTSKRKKESYSIIKDLDLSSRGGKQSLREFYASKAPANAFERNAVFAYYLEKMREVKNITADHIYTCYKEISGTNIPTALTQSLRDVSKDKGWIDVTNINSILVPLKGENFVENDLPAKPVKKEN